MNQQHLLLDIEGTTCPVSFVSDVLFPFAKQELSHYIKQHWNKIPHNKPIQATKKEWLDDQSPESKQIKQQVAKRETEEMDGLIQYLKHLISIDKKSTALKTYREKSGKTCTTTEISNLNCFHKRLNAYGNGASKE